MVVVLGIVIGFIVGAVVLEGPGGVAGAFVGLILALVWRSRSQARARMAARTPVPSAPMLPVGDGDLPSTVAQRLAAIERRLALIEQALGTGEKPVAPETADVATATAIVPAPEVAQPPAFARQRDDALWSRPSATSIAAPADAPASAPAEAQTQTPAWTPAPAPAAPNRLWAWFTSGNALTRIGVVVLFFGVAFLLRYFADLITFPIELKLGGVALAGAALILLGMRFVNLRPGYGLSLQGAGTGILYLTTFAAFRLYDVLSPVPAFALLIATSALAVGLALRANSQALAGLAIAGGFLAPFLVATSAGAPARLFGYFALLNAAIFVLAWARAWRGLNVLGFVFTFVLGLFWGHEFYRPEHFATVEPFLVLFFLFYVTIAVLYAKRGALEAKAPVDALLVFGVPMVAFALQAAMVHDSRYGVAGSALAMAALYAALTVALMRRPEPGLSLLARAFLALAVIFATIAIPFAVDPQWTTAWWALEAAGVYWIGCVQRQPLARGFALLLQLGAAFAFFAGGMEAGERLFLNATFMGTVLVALAALGTAYVADRHRDAISDNEKRLVTPLVLWGVLWWYGGGALELARALPERSEGNAILAYATGSVACALALRRALSWPRLAWFGAALLPTMAVVAFADWDRMRTTLAAYGWAVWPLAWVVHWCVLRAADALRADDAGADAPDGRIAASLRFAHAASAIAAVAWAAWEASEWVGRAFPPATVWVACAAAWPAILYLALVSRAGGYAAWPLATYRDAYVASAGTSIAALLAVWYAIVNLVSPGTTSPLPFVPIANPLDLTLVAALAVLFVWIRATTKVAERPLYVAFGLALFLLLNAMVFRTVHQWLDVPWRTSALFASKPLQAALTLTWTATALPLMLLATRRAIRPLWMVGGGLLAVVVVKLFAIDLSALSGLPRVVAFLGVGVLLLLIGYFAPLPPAAAAADARRAP
ncbi:MAG: DUF2339 domain-containing protein [Burkholderiales bacterium]